MKTFTTALAAALVLSSAHSAQGAPVTYYMSDFEDGSTGGGVAFGAPFGAATNIESAHLDGRSLLFELDDQLQWFRSAAPDSIVHYVGFDYWADTGAVVTQFLDVPTILRFDSRMTGRHHVDLFYDLSSRQANAYLDGALDNSLLTALAWGSTSNSVRIVNQVLGPGFSTSTFEIDNFVWRGDGGASQVPGPSAFALLAFGAAISGFASRSRR